jgi:hypothetical protein
MKRALGVLLAVLLPVLAHAEFQLGAVGVYMHDPASILIAPVSVGDFAPGGEARVKLGILQGAGTFVIYPGANEGLALGLFADVGLSVDVLFLRVGAAAGPTIEFPLGNAQAGPMESGWNLKLSADVNLGPVSVGLVGFYLLSDLADFGHLGDILSGPPWVGLTVLFKVF